MDQPRWLDEAWLEYGQTEVGGIANNPRIVRLFADAGQPQVDNDEVAWCAAFLGACLQRSGISGTRSLMARSYAEWGTQLNAARIGAIAVLERTADPQAGHVGFVVGETADRLLLLGGNQSDAVSVAPYLKSRLVALRWPRTSDAESRAAVQQQPDIFERALAHVLEMEGAFTDDPIDPGGPTNKGITLAEFAEWKGARLDTSDTSDLLAQLKSISQADLSAIYRQRYWTVAGSDRLLPAVALMQFDTGVNQGPVTAIRILQEVVGSAVDGELGPETLGAVAAMPLMQLLDGYAANRRARYRAMPHFWRFGRGWLARVDSTLTLARQIASDTSKSSFSKGDVTMTETTQDPGKWWGNSLTIWGALTTGLAAILPIAGPLLGLDLTGDVVSQLGAQSVTAGQAVIALIGTLMTITGRARATQPIERRIFSLKL